MPTRDWQLDFAIWHTGRTKRYTWRDTPDDPRVLERFVIRAHYFLETVGLPEQPSN